jgi:hypothetical protein
MRHAARTFRSNASKSRSRNVPGLDRQVMPIRFSFSLLRLALARIVASTPRLIRLARRTGFHANLRFFISCAFLAVFVG